ncbi:MAG: hypothetical protein DWQ44_01965 [Bacteroidetes bacterium]|nr:MAG: hypothetical protein DWQ33_05695 [Bacteroidota bacterium]REK04743.1 MAG: hypothetical protein DWQ39_05860 [Bacteroidota bacterium]REK36217.1 MAG: hypothetical protein DWQ44_01965 [Bacteroidota bacterium]REK51412.1 MAG: hypothetical protein DWQ48_00870 [Bacteroidota bacterium]
MKRIIAILSLSGIIFLSSCGSQESGNNTAAVDSTLLELMDTTAEKTHEILDFKFFYTIANLPSPMEIIHAIYSYEVPFNKDLLNSPAAEGKYSTAYKKAINYGIYGIDMAYAAFYGQNQDLLEYYSSTRKLSEKLGVQETFDKFTTSFRESSDNKDSLIKMIDRAYAETDAYLKTNRRLEVAAHVLAGTIIEVQYLSVELMKDREQNARNKDIFEKIYNQKLYLDNLVNLMTEMKKFPSSAKLLAELEVLKAEFDTIKTPDELTKENLYKLSAAIQKVRGGMIS